MERRVTYCIFLLLMLVLLSSCSGPRTRNAVSSHSSFPTNDFVIKRGVNISHWLSQSQRRGAERAAFFTEKDVALIAGLGYDHIRLPVDEEQLWDEAGGKETEAFSLLHNAIGWARKYDLRIVIDLHILRSHYFNAAEKPLWTEPAAQERFFQCWRDLSAELRHYPNALLAYELMNEPVADDPEDWNRLVARALAVVREHEPERYVVIGSNRWQSVHTFPDLRVPAGDPYIILSFHFYLPFPLTHYGTSWTWLKDYRGPVHYPGQLLDTTAFAGLPVELATNLLRENRVYTRDSLEQLLRLPLEKARATGRRLYCGEWGCYPAAPRPDLLQWYRDVRDCLERNDVAWANWDYKGGFGIVDRQTGAPLADLVGALLGE